MEEIYRYVNRSFIVMSILLGTLYTLFQMGAYYILSNPNLWYSLGLDNDRPQDHYIFENGTYGPFLGYCKPYYIVPDPTTGIIVGTLTVIGLLLVLFSIRKRKKQSC